MAYRIDCDCGSCQAFRDDLFEDYCDIVVDVLEAHGVELEDDLVFSLATEMLVAAGVVVDIEPHTEEQAASLDFNILGREIDMEFRRLFSAGDNIIAFRRKVTDCT